jgi:hypothetical protein
VEQVSSETGSSGTPAYGYTAREQLSSATSAGSVVPVMPNISVRFVTRPVGMANDRDDYTFSSYRHEERELIDLLEELEYPVDKKVKTYRFAWQDEA